jgi:tetratricopeptide (TPR) repeat protein
MIKDRNRSDYGTHIHRIKTIHGLAFVLVPLLLCAFLFPVFTMLKNNPGNERKELLRLWEEGSYEEAYTLSRTGLDRKPMDYFLLTIHGFSAYQLGIAQINNHDTLAYIDDCIWSLRKAMLTRGSDGRVYYVLGKAYYYKGDSFADLSVKFLERARSAAYQAEDIPEYLGLAYAAIRDYRSSVAAFTRALNPASGAAQSSDVLLLSIARSYLALNENDSARAYLLRCIEISRDARTIVASRLLFAGLLMREENFDEAESQYNIILNESGENAEAHYQLGELYAARGDTTRARAEWRRVVRLDPAHALAKKRINL